MSELNLIAVTTFGLEATVKRELTKLGFKNIKAMDGRVDFTGDISSIPTANIWLRAAVRVLINIGEFDAFSFDELFEKTKALDWGEWIPIDGKFTVTGKSIRSTLFSVSDCQSIVKKAVVEKLKQKYKVEWFEETGAEYKIQVGILKDHVTLTIDTSGPGLHKRGYREVSMEAPIKETLAYSLIDLSYYRKDRILLDPMCGSGTIPIEAALAAKNIAPGISRKFISEGWEQIDKKIWKDARAKAYSSINVDFTPTIFGSDCDPKAIELAKYNATKAGVDDAIHFELKRFEDIKLPGEHGVLICNPPYGERLGNDQEVIELYESMGRLLKDKEFWNIYIITSNEDFEKYYGKKADTLRKLYNGMIKTNYYQYYGKKPK